MARRASGVLQVPGRVAKRTTDSGPPICSPCEKGPRNSSVVAKGYCQDCNEYLCADCYDYHPRIGVCRDHVLVDGVANVVATQRVPYNRRQGNDEATDVCKQDAAGNRPIAYHCEDHKVLICQHCYATRHKQCQLTDVEDVIGRFRNEQRTAIGQFERSLDQSTHQIQDNSSNIGKIFADAQDDIQKFRTKISIFLDRKEKELVGKAQQFRTKDNELMESLKDKSKALRREIGAFKTQINDPTAKKSEIFQTIQHGQRHVENLKREIRTLEDAVCIQTYSFKPSDAMRDVMTSDALLGEIDVKITGTSSHAMDRSITSSTSSLSLEDANVSATASKIDIKTSEDKKTNSITGMVFLSSTKLLIADCKNKCVKVLDTLNKKITSRLELEKNPWDVARLPNDEAAVSLFEKNVIQIVGTRAELTLLRQIKVQGDCRGIYFQDGRLVVTYEHPEKVEIMDLQGNAQAGIQFNLNTTDIKGCPRYVTYRNCISGPCIYVCDDLFDNKVTKLSIDNATITKICEVGLESASGLVLVGDKQLAVCGIKHSAIYILTDDCGEMKKVKTWPCVKKPKALAMSPSGDMIYVSSYSKGEERYLHLYQLQSPGATGSSDDVFEGL